MAAMAIVAPASWAAPTCQDRNGDTIRCGTPGAMPVGWTLSPEERAEKERLKPPVYPTAAELFEVAAVLGLFFALFALMPEFEGNWDKQEGDEKRGR